jgi:hypothetical protein
MPALLDAPPEVELSPVSFFGRSFNEYLQFFALDPTALRGQAVLDVGAGPSSFVAEACRRGVDAVAVDPLYGAPTATLAGRVQHDYRGMFAQMRAKPRLFKVNGRTVSPLSTRWPKSPMGSAPRSRAFFSSLDEAEVDRRAAAQRFLADYDVHYAHRRYIGAALPQLPFLDGAFDLVLCAHLLFTYADLFDFEWHLAACRELVRVSGGEVRIHPLCGRNGKRYAELDRLRAELLAGGIASEIAPVAYEFFAGASSMLVLNPRRRD